MICPLRTAGSVISVSESAGALALAARYEVICPVLTGVASLSSGSWPT